MLKFIGFLAAFAVMMPIVITILVFITAKMITQHTWRSVHITVNLTTWLYIVSVVVELNVVYGRTFLVWIILILIVLFMSIMLVQWRLFTEVVFQKTWKVFLKICFIIFLLAYICLIFIGIIANLL